MVESKIEVDRCVTCRGLWLDHGELEQLQQTIERDYRGVFYEPPNPVEGIRRAAEQAERGEIACPKCGTLMTAQQYGYTSQVFIDICPEGCGVWLDDGELRELELFFERSQQEGQLPVAWRLWAGVVSVFRGRSKSGTK